MKQQLSTLLIFLALAFSACQSPEHAAYVSTVSVIETADAAVGAFDKWSQENPVSIEDVQRVRKLALEFQASKEIARATQSAVFAAADDIGKQDSKRKAEAAVKAAESAALKLTALIRAIAPMLETFNK